VFRAVAKDRITAEVVGVNTRLVEQISFAAAAALAGIAGFMIVPVTGAEANIGTALGFKGFAVAIVGGLAAPRGALLIGLLYGLMESTISAYLFAGVRDILGFSIMIAALYFLPFGIFGEPERVLR
jgi:branched-chain amino acid transport system permease protein